MNKEEPLSRKNSTSESDLPRSSSNSSAIFAQYAGQSDENVIPITENFLVPNPPIQNKAIEVKSNIPSFSPEERPSQNIEGIENVQFIPHESAISSLNETASSTVSPLQPHAPLSGFTYYTHLAEATEGTSPETVALLIQDDREKVVDQKKKMLIARQSVFLFFVGLLSLGAGAYVIFYAQEQVAVVDVIPSAPQYALIRAEENIPIQEQGVSGTSLREKILKELTVTRANNTITHILTLTTTADITERLDASRFFEAIAPDSPPLLRNTFKPFFMYGVHTHANKPYPFFIIQTEQPENMSRFMKEWEVTLAQDLSDYLLIQNNLSTSAFPANSFKDIQVKGRSYRVLTEATSTFFEEVTSATKMVALTEQSKIISEITEETVPTTETKEGMEVTGEPAMLDGTETGEPATLEGTETGEPATTDGIENSTIKEIEEELVITEAPIEFEGKALIYWGFLDFDTLIIATNERTLEELIGRWYGEVRQQ